MKALKEIRMVGLKNWIWFVVWLHRNEFHPRLDLRNYYPDLKRLERDRRRAHEIDLALLEVRCA